MEFNSPSCDNVDHNHYHNSQSMSMLSNEQHNRIQQWQLQQQQYGHLHPYHQHQHHSSLGPLQQPQDHFQSMAFPSPCNYSNVNFPFINQQPCSSSSSSSSPCTAAIPFYAMNPYFQQTLLDYWSYLQLSAMAGGSSSSLTTTATTTTTNAQTTATGFHYAHCNHQAAGNTWLTSCPSTDSSYGFDRLNTRLRDDSAARLQQLISMPEDNDHPIDLDVLMPNGTIIPINVAQNATFLEVKEEVFELSQRGPMYGALRDRKLYSFYYVDESGAQKECVDEEIRLCDACPVGNILKLVEHQENIDDLELDEQIGQLIGKSLKDFDALLNPEVNEFRYRMRSLCEEIVKTRQNNSWLDKMRYAYPTSVDPSDLTVLPAYLQDRLPKGGIINAQIIFDDPKFTIMVAVNCQITPSELLRQSIELILNDPVQSKELMKNQNHYDSYLFDSSHNGTNNQEEESYYDSSFPSDNINRNFSNPFLDPSQYLLKINGTLEYLLDNYSLIKYRMIQEILLSDDPMVALLAIPRQSIEFEDEPIYAINTALTDYRPRSHSIISLGSLGSVIMATNSSRRRAHQVVVSSWSLDRKLLIKIHSAHINQLQFNSEITRVAVMVGIFHGGEMLCDSHITTPVSLKLIKSSPQNPNMEIFDTIPWEEDIVFNLKVSDLPRMARIAFTVVGFTGSQSSRKMTLRHKPIPIAWANINFFDYRGLLWESSTTLSMWIHDNENECVDDTESVFKPLETVVPNPNIDQTIFLTISFTKYSEGDNTVIRFPTLKEILKEYPTIQQQQQQSNGVATKNESSSNVNRKNSVLTVHEENEYESTYNPKYNKSTSESQQLLTTNDTTISNSSPDETCEEREKDIALIKKISEKDLLHRMEEGHRDLLWRLRFECCQQCPESLCKLLISFKWNNQRMIGEAISLLQSWPKLSPGKALELLDYAYADNLVRKYAIECLKDLPNEDLSQYLLQLVQALKYESYIYNDLVQFLLERAFESQRIGHHLFWLLRSEMHNPAVSVTFGLILEAYCRGAIDHIYILSRQMECINKLKRVNIIIRDDRSRENRDKKICWMQEILEQKFYQETFTNVINPLNPIHKFGRLKVKKCKFMDSKMKPLWLVFENYDSGASDIHLIFKNGDDLRQDMLTLQMIRIMDRLWKEAGYDFRMTPYRCISVEHCVGLIEVVLNADTIANIQKNKANAAIAAFKKGSLLAWLRDHNPQEADLNRAIEEFTLSCAGYCVATYILGVADRHNDNIMVKKNGQLFHIDFGHILGKFKEKFGIRRERVPFVLTNDFVYVITHGEQASKKSEYFRRFQNYCEEAFIIIRRRGSFFISLFAMMLSTGIPEISTEDDLQYLRETLVLDKNEEEARAHFSMKFTEALKNSWKTSFNWTAHSLAKDNRMNDR